MFDDALTVDVSPRTNLRGWNWGHLLVAFGIFEGPSGNRCFVPVMATNAQSMAIVPAQVDRGMAFIAPQHAALAPGLFKQQVGFPSQAAYAASMATLMRETGRKAGAHRQRYEAEKLKDEYQELLQCANTSPIFTFAAWVRHSSHGAAVMFCGKPWISAYSYTLDTATASLLNEPWDRTAIAKDLARFAQEANAAMKDAIPCARTLEQRQAALEKWFDLMKAADRLAHRFLQDNLPGWAGKSVGFTPTAMPWMTTLTGVAQHIGLGELRVPAEHLQVGGCHIELAA